MDLEGNMRWGDSDADVNEATSILIFHKWIEEELS